MQVVCVVVSLTGCRSEKSGLASVQMKIHDDYCDCASKKRSQRTLIISIGLVLVDHAL